MRKTIFSAILILSTMSCAAFMEDFGEGKYDVAIQQTAVALALTSKPAVRRNDLLLGLYYYSLISPPVQKPRSSYSSAWDYVFYDYDYNHALLDYEYKLQDIHDMEMFKLEMEVRRIINELKSAEDD